MTLRHAYTLLAAIMLAMIALSGCIGGPEDRAHISDARYREARRAFERTRSVEVARMAMEQAHWPRSMINEAVYTLYEGVGSVDAIDTAMKLGANHPMGPLQLADFIGLDTCLAIMQVLYDGLADTKYRPCPLLVKYVEAGWLGKKVDRGFYDYTGDTPVPTR